MQDSSFENYKVNIYNQYAFEVTKEFVKKKMQKGMMLGIFGLKGVGKTKLLQAVVNYYKEVSPETLVYITADELQCEIEKMIKKKDIFLISLKQKVKKAEVVCLDEISRFLVDDRLKPWYMEWFYYCERRKKRIIYTYDCSEMMYSAIQTLGNLKPQAIMVGIPKAGQNRNLETIRVLD